MITAESGVFRHITITVIAITLGGIATSANAWRGDEIAPWQGTDAQGVECSGLQIPFGPFDYLKRDNLKSQLNVVEETHFSAEIENLERGQTGSAIADIHYTLMAWPNHHRALQSALKYRLAHRGKWPKNTGASPAECYLQRAIKFSPRDPLPKILFGLFMHKMKQYEVAAEAYRGALKILPNDIMTKYNLGLALVELKKYKEAEKIAEEVYAANYPLPGLKNKLAAPREKPTTDKAKNKPKDKAKEGPKGEQTAQGKPEKDAADKAEAPAEKTTAAASKKTAPQDKPVQQSPANAEAVAKTGAAAKPAANNATAAPTTSETTDKPTAADKTKTAAQPTAASAAKPASKKPAEPDTTKAAAANKKSPEFTAEQLEQLKQAMREQAMLESASSPEPPTEPALAP